MKKRQLNTRGQLDAALVREARALRASKGWVLGWYPSIQRLGEEGEWMPGVGACDPTHAPLAEKGRYLRACGYVFGPAIRRAIREIMA